MAKRVKSRSSSSDSSPTGFVPRPKSAVSKQGLVMVTLGVRKQDALFLDGLAEEHCNGNRTQLVRECLRYGLKAMGHVLPSDEGLEDNSPQETDESEE